MRLLLDTNVLLWWLTDSERLTPVWRRLIAEPRNVVYVSAVSVVEISLKTSLGKLPPLPEPIPDVLVTARFQELALTVAHGRAVADLPWHHRDPFDRMLIAQALVEDLPVLSSDRIFAVYGLRVVDGSTA